MSARSATTEMTGAEHCFVVPPLEGPISGGTLYNRELLAALTTFERVRAVELSAPELDSELGTARSVWVDSLYLAAVPGLKQRARGRVGLIVHYLPSFVALGRAASSPELRHVERSALDCADAFLVTSAFMRGALEALLAGNQRSIFVSWPGTHARLASTPEPHPELRVVMIGNVVPGKGIEPWLRALEAELRATDRLQLSILGSLTAEPEYAERCERLVEQSRALSERVTFFGALTQPDVLSHLACSDLFVSASRMESYGIALNEARVVGVPILALAAGNAAQHVAPAAGGELVSSDAELAQACVALARAPAVRGKRLAQARARAPRGRSWLSTARELSAQLAEWEK
jgi:glycosyltransferase involved in cell wall biosynthesis